MPKAIEKEKRGPTVSIIGAGRLGSALALAFDSHGYRMDALLSRRKGSAQKARRLLSGSPLALSESQLDALPASRLILIATPDDAIPPVAAQLAIAQKGMPRGRTVLHTSGALSSAVLKPLAQVGFHVGSLHPLISVSESISGAASIPGSFFCLEGAGAALRVMHRVVQDFGAHDFTIETRQKALYHTAAVTASGHMVALFAIAIELLQHCGLEPKEAQLVLLPLMASTIKNLSTSQPAAALTGPFARGDLTTIRRHLEALGAEGLADALAAYCLLGKKSLKLAGKTRTQNDVRRQIVTLLNQ